MFTLLLSLYFGKLRAIHKPSHSGNTNIHKHPSLFLSISTCLHYFFSIFLSCEFIKVLKQRIMATAAASASAMLTPAAIAGKGNRFSQRRSTKVRYISGLNSFEGLKAHNHIASLGVPLCADQSFAKIVSSLRSQGKGNGGGALSATCNAAINEIFKIATILPGLVLVGVAVGFVLLRIEAYVEESE